MALPDVVVGGTGHVTHHNVLHNWTQDDDSIRYVSKGSRASDSNDGRTPMEPKATLQSAYDSLPAGGGVIYLSPGRHDVGASGLQLNRTKPVGLYGSMWRRVEPYISTTWTTGGGTVIFTSAGTPPTQLISFPNPGTLVNGRGFVARDIAFEIKSGMTYAIFANSVNDGYVENCAFLHAGTGSTAIGLTQDGTLGNDSSWWRVLNNTCEGGGLFKTLTTQHNQHVIADNYCFAGTGTFIHIKGAFRCVIKGNNFEAASDEGPAAGTPFVLLQDSNACVTHANMGEAYTAGTVFMRLDNCQGCMLQDLGTSSPTATDKLYDFTNGSRDNLVIMSSYTFQADLYTAAASVVFADSDAQLRNYRITSGTGLASTVWLPNLKRGAGTPEGAVYGSVGDLFLRTDGGTTTTLYVKTSGASTNTGWTAK